MSLPAQPPSGNEQRRDAWVRSALKNIPAGRRLIDVGAGTQRYRAMCGHLVYVAQDFGEYDGAGDGRGLQTGEFDYGRLDIRSDIVAIPVPDASFDVVLCTEVLEHVPSPERALAEMARILRPGGELILTAPFVSYTHFSPYHFCTGFNRYYYQHHLPLLGLKIEEMAANGDFFDLQAQELDRADSVGRQYARARLRWWERLARRVVARGLRRLSERGAGSAEFACQGLHVRARKAGR